MPKGSTGEKRPADVGFFAAPDGYPQTIDAPDPLAWPNVWQEEVGQTEDDIDRQQLNTFQPVRSSVVRDLPCD